MPLNSAAGLKEWFMEKLTQFYTCLKGSNVVERCNVLERIICDNHFFKD